MLVENVKLSSKDLFKYIKGKQNVRKGIGPLRDDKGRLESKGYEMVGLLNFTFS